jgi:glycosyltransferase involved in cell wall biosynthesis
MIFGVVAQRRYLRGASVLHASTEDEEVAIRMFKVMTPVAVIPNGVDVRVFSHLPASRRFEEEYPELIGKTVLLFLARLHPQKGLDMLASAFGRVAKSRGDVHLVLAGPDSYGYRKEIERILVMNGARERVTFTGMLTRDQKMAALSRADVFVLPSYSEGFSMGILEAMACHLPVLITRPCHFPDVSKHRAGLVIEPNEEQLAESIHALVCSQPARDEMGENGYRLVQKEYSLEVITRRIISMYEGVF